jgi:hypothetical protein
MRRLNLVLLALAIPAANLAAQIYIPLRTPRPDRPAEKPPQAPGIRDVRSYNRYKLSRFSLESTPMISYMQTTGAIAKDIPMDYWSFGDATLISYRAVPSLFVTSVFSASSAGAPFGMNSSEFGVRLKPWTSPRVAMFADARMSYAFTSNFALPSSAVPFAAMYMDAYTDFSMSRGHGALLGLGSETRLNDRYSLTMSMNYTHYEMRTNRLYDPNSGWTYRNNTTRLNVGVRYNHGRWQDIH